LRATENGYRVGILEVGKGGHDQDVPKTIWDVTKYERPKVRLTR